MCRFCNGDDSLFYDKEHPYIREVYIEGDGSMSINTCMSAYKDDDLLDASINIEINFCPACGEKLKK